MTCHLENSIDVRRQRRQREWPPVTAALGVREACVALGGDWLWWDEMAKRLKFLYYEHGKREEMETAWQTYTQMVGN